MPKSRAIARAIDDSLSRSSSPRQMKAAVGLKRRTSPEPHSPTSKWSSSATALAADAIDAMRSARRAARPSAERAEGLGAIAQDEREHGRCHIRAVLADLPQGFAAPGLGLRFDVNPGVFLIAFHAPSL